MLVLRQGRYSSDLPVLDVIGASREVARDALQALLDEAQRASVYKGHTITVEGARRENVTILMEPYKVGDTRAALIEGPSKAALELVEVK